jgi:hypothetical protein
MMNAAGVDEFERPRKYPVGPNPAGHYLVEVTLANVDGEAPGATIYHFTVTDWQLGEHFLELAVVDDYLPEAPAVRTNQRGTVRRYYPLDRVVEFVSGP